MHVVLVHPQIPQNTGSIARTCAALKTPLHIVHPIPFELSERNVRRAGLDYWPWVTLIEHASWDAFTAAPPSQSIWYFSKRGTIDFYDAAFEPDDALVFGSETTGLAPMLPSLPPSRLLKIPMLEPEVRSLNLSNAVSLVLYEAFRQVTRRGERWPETSRHHPHDR